MTVLVVGAGPTGLTVAALLGQRGIACTVVERRSAPADLPRAVHLDDEAMGVLHELGVAQQLRTRAGLGLRIVDADLRTMAQFDRASGATLQGYPQANMLDQPELEALLRSRIEQLPGVDLLESVELVALHDRQASLRSATGAVGVEEFSYVLGCDGAGSTVRELAGIGWKDLRFQERWLVVDAKQPVPLGTWDGVFQVCDPARAATYMQIAEDRYRWEFRLHDGETADCVDLDALLRPWKTSEDLEVLRRTEYTFRAGLATSWHRGHVLLLGDAAHQTPPFIGQGLGLGLRDAANLAWKLDRVLRGAGPELLTTYESERAPHAEALIRKAMVVGWALTGGQRKGASVRRRALALLCRAPSLMSAVLDRGTPALRRGPLVARRSPAGRLFPQVADQGGGFALVVTHRPSAEVLALAAALNATQLVAPPAVDTWMRQAGTTAALVRPDRIVLAATDRTGRLSDEGRRTARIAVELTRA